MNIKAPLPVEIEPENLKTGAPPRPRPKAPPRPKTAVFTEDQKGNAVARAVWHFLQQSKAVQFVPWSRVAASGCCDPIRVAEQRGWKEALAQVEQVIVETSVECESAAQKRTDAEAADQSTEQFPAGRFDPLVDGE